MSTTPTLSTAIRPRPIHLPGGAKLVIRPLRREDARAYERFAYSLSAETLHNRLLGAGLAITPERLAYMVEVDQLTHVALAAIERATGGERIVGVARYALEADPTLAEFAVTVADAWQGQGVGRALLAALVRRARAAGVKMLFGDTFPSNTAMLALMRSADFALAPTPGDAHLTRGSMLLRAPRPRKTAARTAPRRAPSPRRRPS
jgi:acetyltransferase